MAKKYGVEDLAKAWGVEPSTARVKLRALKAKKSGQSYEFGEDDFRKLKVRGMSEEKPASKKSTKPAPKKSTAKAKSTSKKSEERASA